MHVSNFMVLFVVVTTSCNVISITFINIIFLHNKSYIIDLDRRCRSLKNITIPDSVTFIGSRAFEGCVNLSSITMGSGVETIGEYTFKDCILLTTLRCSNKLSRIGQRAFYNCRSLGDIYFESQDIIIENGIFQGCNQWVMKVHGPEGSSIQAYAKKTKTKFITE